MSHPSVTDRLFAWLPLLPVLGLLFGSYWLNLQVRPFEPSTAAERHDVDFVVDGLSLTALDDEGRSRYTLLTEKMWHYPDDDTTHLQAPSLTHHFKDRAPTRISSKRGTLSSRGDEIELIEDVSILLPGRLAGDDRRFHTEYLHVLPDLGRADTSASVVMIGRHDKIGAVGMELDNKARTVRLLQEVRAVHE